MDRETGEALMRMLAEMLVMGLVLGALFGGAVASVLWWLFG